MTIITPDYYKDFKCIAGRCRHNCCIGWEIDIDDATFNKYNNLNGAFAGRLKDSIAFENTPHFRLDENKRCPFLNGDGLCDIIINSGEDMLCQTCRDHPRFYNFYSGFTEVGLGLCCEAAAEIILAKRNKTILNLTAENLQIPVVNFREKLFGILQDRNLPIQNRVNNMLNMVDAKLPVKTDWYSVLSHLEKMDNTWDNYLLRIKDGIETNTDDSLDIAYEQLLVYLIFRHFTDCQYDELPKERVMFAALIYKIIKTMNTSNTIEELIEISRLYSCEIEYSDENINRLLEELGK